MKRVLILLIFFAFTKSSTAQKKRDTDTVILTKSLVAKIDAIEKKLDSLKIDRDSIVKLNTLRSKDTSEINDLKSDKYSLEKKFLSLDSLIKLKGDSIKDKESIIKDVEEREKKTLKNEIDLIIKSGKDINKNLLESFKERAYHYNPTNRSELIGFISLYDSLQNAIALFSNEYDSAGVNNMKKRVEKLNCSNFPGLEKDQSTIKYLLNKYESNYLNVLTILQGSYLLYKIDKDKFSTELLRCDGYTKDYPYLKTMVTAFSKENTVEMERINKLPNPKRK